MPTSADIFILHFRTETFKNYGGIIVSALQDTDNIKRNVCFQRKPTGYIFKLQSQDETTLRNFCYCYNNIRWNSYQYLTGYLPRKLEPFLLSDSVVGPLHMSGTFSTS